MQHELAELNGYRETVQELAAKADGKETVLNRSPDHAAIVISEILKKSERIVLVITSELANVAYGTPDVVQAALAFLRKSADCKIEILAESDFDITQNTLLSSIRFNGLIDQVRLYKVADAAKRLYSSHFVVGDGLYLRLQKSRDDYGAMVQFGNAEVGLRLTEIFKILKPHSTLVNLE